MECISANDVIQTVLVTSFVFRLVVLMIVMMFFKNVDIDIMFIDSDRKFMQMLWMKLNENFYQFLCL